MTDRRKESREEAIRREGYERYRDLVENSRDLICTHDLEGRILSVNETALRMMGYPPEAILGKRLADLLEPDARDGVEAYLAEVRSSECASGVMRVRTVSGEIRYWEYANTLRTEGVAVPVVRGMAHDVTDRVLAEKELKKREGELRKLSNEFNAILDGIPDSILLVSRDFRLVWANRAAAANMGKERQEISGSPCHVLWHRRSSPCDPCPVERTYRTGEPFRKVAVLPDGKTIEVRTLPIMEAGGVSEVIVIGRDITDQRKMEGQLQQALKMEAVGMLAGGVAHDFNNMLNVILGYCEMALSRLSPGAAIARDIEEIRKAGQRSAELTRQLLAFSRKQITVPKVVRMNDTIAEQMNMLRRLIGEDIQIDFLPCGDPWHIRIDPSQVAQILANLAVNARDAIRGVGRIAIETSNATLDEAYCRSHVYATPGEYAVLIFSDTGIGMQAGTLERIFEPFFTTKAVGEGTGLGLSTVYGIVKQNGGIINAYSEPGLGTTFRVYLPRVREDAAEAAADGGESLPEGGTETLLLVEDEEQILHLASRILGDRGYRVLSASSPEEACRIVERHTGPIHLLLSDVVMPGMNGKELQERIEKMRPGIRTVFMSGYTAESVGHRGILGKCVAFVQKPFTAYSLAEKVRLALDSRA